METKRLGYWSIRDYVRRGSADVPTFCGWKTLENLVKSAEREMVSGLMATLFLTGCRVSECLDLRAEMFRVDEGWVRVYGAPVLKKGKSAEPQDRIRNIPIPISEPLVPYMLEYIDSRANHNDLFPYGRRWAYKWIKKVDPNWWPHRFRAERASQLVIEYGFNVPKLMKWFSWSDPKVPTRYVRLDISDLEATMRRDSK